MSRSLCPSDRPVGAIEAAPARLATTTMKSPPRRRPRNAAFALYRDLVANAHAAVLFVARDGTVHASNRAARAMFNVDARLPRRTRHVADLFDAGDRERVARACSLSLSRAVDDRLGVFRIAAARGRGAPSRWRCVAFDGARFEADVSFEEVDGGEWPIALIVRRPLGIAPSRPAAAADAPAVVGRRAAATAAEDVDVVSVVSHELRTPLNAIVGLAGVLRDREDECLDPQLLRDLRQIERTANDMRRMVDALLELNRPSDGAEVAGGCPVDVAHDVAAEFAGLAARHRCTLDVSLPPERLGPIVTDAEVVRRVLRNVVGNAIKHASGSSVTIGIAAVADGGVAFTVADNGPGIEAARIDRLFERHAERLVAHRLGSSGIGLAICRQFLRRVGGRIDVRSTAGVGTAFTVTIPGGSRSR